MLKLSYYDFFNYLIIIFSGVSLFIVIYIIIFIYNLFI